MNSSTNINRTILLTGATGFLGSHLLEALVDQSFKVLVIKRSSSDVWRIKHLLHKVECFDIDVFPLSEVFKAHKIDCVVHLATDYKKTHSFHDITPLLQTNISFGVELLELAAQNQTKSFLYMSTFFVYAPSDSPLKESSLINPLNLYAASKFSFEFFLDYHCKKYGINGITFRLFSPYGPKDQKDKLIPTIVRGALRNNEINLSGPLKRLDFIYTKDIVQALLFGILVPPEKITNHEIFNLGTGISHSIEEIVFKTEEITGNPIKVKWNEARKKENSSVMAEISKVKEILGWTPSFSIEYGLRETIAWSKEMLNNAN